MPFQHVFCFPFCISLLAISQKCDKFYAKYPIMQKLRNLKETPKKQKTKNSGLSLSDQLPSWLMVL